MSNVVEIIEDDISDYLSEKGFHCCALIYALRWKRDEKLGNIEVYLQDEMRRLRDFLILCRHFDYLPLKDANDKTTNSLVIPLIRVIFEGWFRVHYIFCDIEKTQRVNPEILKKHFEKILDDVRDKYNKFLTLTDEKVAFDLPNLEGDKKHFPIRDMINKSHNHVGRGVIPAEKDWVYKLYQYCCFYAHGNMNEGLTGAVGIKEMPHIDLNPIIEVIAENYLKTAAIIIGDESFMMRLKGALQSSSYSGIGV